MSAYPCAKCGWGPAYGIHLPALTGDRKGQPWGHAYEPPRLLQDETQTSDSKGLSRWLSTRPNARQEARNVAAEIVELTEPAPGLSKEK